MIHGITAGGAASAAPPPAPIGLPDTLAINLPEGNAETDAKRANCELIINIDDDGLAVGFMLAGGDE